MRDRLLIAKPVAKRRARSSILDTILDDPNMYSKELVGLIKQAREVAAREGLFAERMVV